MRFVTLLLLPLLLWSSPAHAAQTECEAAVSNDAHCHAITVLGHRGIQGPKEATNENTLWAFRRDDSLGVGCEADTWMSKDGVSFISHDTYIKRVYDPASFPPGVTGKTRIDSMTWSQISQLRTYGGQPVVRLERLLKFLGGHDMFCAIEVKYQQVNPSQVSTWLRQYHADRATFYATPKCGPDGVLPSPLAGVATVGVKYLGGCEPTPRQMASAGFSYVIGSIAMLTADYVARCHAEGLLAGNYDSGDHDTWATLVQNNADIMIAPHPAHALHAGYGGSK